MIPILLGLVSAMIFSIVTYMMYGLEGVMLRDWIDQVFWALILAGFAIGVINAIWRCFPCLLSRLTHSARLTETWCSTCKQ
ncbi:MAG TPA: hypothetical protein ENJ12_09570 [Thiolapillus brandeum]|uniref:Uncharacterized protein n=1 Tax=Thiolapillus brandeum TaxID=1076588 RepID=A0A831RYM9_9GAMM|nr:hypothetical protein [Thiolapillus brandeum]